MVENMNNKNNNYTKLQLNLQTRNPKADDLEKVARNFFYYRPFVGRSERQQWQLPWPHAILPLPQRELGLPQ
jgi:hypothetical protein